MYEKDLIIIGYIWRFVRVGIARFTSKCVDNTRKLKLISEKVKNKFS